MPSVLHALPSQTCCLSEDKLLRLINGALSVLLKMIVAYNPGQGCMNCSVTVHVLYVRDRNSTSSEPVSPRTPVIVDKGPCL